LGWWGKLIGGAFGYLLGGPLGALLGIALGGSFDKGYGKAVRGGWERLDPGDQERVQTAFFTATFSVMGHLAKADGAVSRDEIQLARDVMQRMNLSADLRRTAIRLFTEGKATDFPLDDVLEQLRRECHRRRNLLQMFIEIQLHAAYADGVVHEAERRVLLRLCERLGFSSVELRHLEVMVRAAIHLGARERGGPEVRPARAALQEAYEVLGVSRQASNDEVKKAYRRLMNQHHPDKLVAKGLPEEMIDLATDKTQEIRKAYELIMDSRK
jgi:DnaJ like chaperone protein